VEDSALASTARHLTADGAVSFAASADGASKSEATASAKGTTAEAESDKGSTKADDQTKGATGLANKQSGESKSVDQSASTESGSVSVAASLALNVANNDAIARVGDGLTIKAGDGGGTGGLIVRSSNLMLAEAIAQGVASTKADGDAIGIGVAINVAHENNEASVGAGASVTADGAIIYATMASEEIELEPTTIPVVDIANDTIFLGASHGGLKTGDKVTYDNGGGTSIAGLTSGLTEEYSVLVEDGGKIKLRELDTGGTVGAIVDLTSSGSGTGHKLKHAIPL
jgi:hypothetical protein